LPNLKLGFPAEMAQIIIYIISLILSVVGIDLCPRGSLLAPSRERNPT